MGEAERKGGQVNKQRPLTGTRPKKTIKSIKLNHGQGCFLAVFLEFSTLLSPSTLISTTATNSSGVQAHLLPLQSQIVNTTPSLGLTIITTTTHAEHNDTSKKKTNTTCAWFEQALPKE